MKERTPRTKKEGDNMQRTKKWNSRERTDSTCSKPNLKLSKSNRVNKPEDKAKLREERTLETCIK